MISVRSKNQVIPLPIVGEIFLRVINDVVCADRAHHVHIPRAAHASHFSPERFGNLHGKHTNTARRTMYQDLLPWLNLSFIAKTLQGGDCRDRYGRGFLEREIGRFQYQCIFTSTYVLGKTTPNVPEYLIIWLKLLDVSANCFDPPRNIRSEYCVFWFEKPIAHEAHQERFPSQKMPVSCICGCRMNFYQYFIVLGSRFFDLFKFQNIGWSVVCVDNSFHKCSSKVVRFC